MYKVLLNGDKMQDWQHEQNLKLAQQLKEEGYELKYNTDGYEVWYQKQFIAGASVKLPRDKLLHWRHARANIRGFLENAIVVAQRHKQQSLVKSRKTIEQIQDEYFEKRKQLIAEHLRSQDQESYDIKIKELNIQEDIEIELARNMTSEGVQQQ
jgi:hypothetical protein